MNVCPECQHYLENMHPSIRDGFICRHRVIESGVISNAATKRLVRGILTRASQVRAAAFVDEVKRRADEQLKHTTSGKAAGHVCKS